MYIDFSESGKLFVFSGPVRANKTGSLLGFMDKVTYAGIPWQLFKPQSDIRPDLFEGTEYGPSDVISRGVGGTVYGLPATILPNDDIRLLPELLDPEVVRQNGFVGIDEVTLLTGASEKWTPETMAYVIGVFQALLNAGCSAVTAGLDKNYRGEAYGPMPQLLAMADHSEKLSAICMDPGCKKKATMTKRLLPDGRVDSWLSGEKVVGNAQYLATCRRHHEIRDVPTELTLEHFLKQSK